MAFVVPVVVLVARLRVVDKVFVLVDVVVEVVVLEVDVVVGIIQTPEMQMAGFEFNSQSVPSWSFGPIKHCPFRHMPVLVHGFTRHGL